MAPPGLFHKLNAVEMLMDEDSNKVLIDDTIKGNSGNMAMQF